MQYKKSLYPELLANKINIKKYHWLVTGAAGFIGSNLLEALLSLGQEVTGLDDLSVGNYKNIETAISLNKNIKNNEENFKFIKGSINDVKICLDSAKKVDFILHQAALASVPGSLENPAKYHEINTSGFVNILEAARENNVKRVVFASSSAVYGDNKILPKTENLINSKSEKNFLSPYALTKYINEECAEFWTKIYNLECVGLRYFNIFGPRQDPKGAYAAVISKWTDSIKTGKIPVIYGDGSATRDFCSVHNVVFANLSAAISKEASGKIFNVACGTETSLKELLNKIYKVFAPEKEIKFILENPRKGDILHSSASIELAEKFLNYEPLVKLEKGLEILRDSDKN